MKVLPGMIEVHSKSLGIWERGQVIVGKEGVQTGRSSLQKWYHVNWVLEEEDKAS